MSDNKTAAVVTGIGLATALGLGREKTWHNLLAGQTGIAPDAQFPGILTARVRDMNVPPEARLLSLGFLAAAEAIDDSGGMYGDIDPLRFGCTVSVSKPDLNSSRSTIAFSDAYYPSTVGSQLARVFRLGGPVQNIAAACATGADSVIMAAQWVREGWCDAVLAGAVESSLHPLYVAGFSRMGVLASQAVCPFDRRRDGFAMGEGAGILLIERKDRALLRGAKIYAEIAGHAMGCDAGGTVAFDPKAVAITQALEKAVASAGNDSVGYINAHGTATALNDAIETRAIKKVFGSRACHIPVSSTKAATGHLLGASGAVELAFTCLALRDNVVPPTLNYAEPDKKCDLDYVPRFSRAVRMDCAVSLSFGFGGQIGIVALRR